MTRVFVIMLASLAAGGAAAIARGDSTPVGPLPPGPVASLEAQRRELVALALPLRRGAGVWRLARPLDGNVLRQVSEGNVGSALVLVFRARGVGSAAVSLALTKSDVSPKALESRRFDVRVR
jgi:hypothetical protein